MFPTFLFEVHRHRHRRRSQGITLVDVCVAVLILSIVSAVTVPRMAEVLDRQRIEAASHLLVQSLTYLKNRAIIEGKTVHLELTHQPLGLRCEQIAMPNRPGQTFFLDMSQEANITESNYEGISSPHLTIDRFGYLYNQGESVNACTITIGNKAAVATITIRHDSIFAETSRR